jgi:hypothetical protein
VTLRTHEAGKKDSPGSARRPFFDGIGWRSNLWVRRRIELWSKLGNWWDDVSGCNARRTCSRLDAYRARNTEPLKLGGVCTLTLGTTTPRIHSRPEHDHDYAVRTKWNGYCQVESAGSLGLGERARS